MAKLDFNSSTFRFPFLNVNDNDYDIFNEYPADKIVHDEKFLLSKRINNVAESMNIDETDFYKYHSCDNFCKTEQ